MVREIAGFAPYEKRCLELLKVNILCVRILEFRMFDDNRADVRKRGAVPDDGASPQTRLLSYHLNSPHFIT